MQPHTSPSFFYAVDKQHKKMFIKKYIFFKITKITFMSSFNYNFSTVIINHPGFIFKICTFIKHVHFIFETTFQQLCQKFIAGSRITQYNGKCSNQTLNIENIPTFQLETVVKYVQKQRWKYALGGDGCTGNLTKDSGTFRKLMTRPLAVRSVRGKPNLDNYLF